MIEDIKICVEHLHIYLGLSLSKDGVMYLQNIFENTTFL